MCIVQPASIFTTHISARPTFGYSGAARHVVIRIGGVFHKYSPGGDIKTPNGLYGTARSAS